MQLEFDHNHILIDSKSALPKLKRYHYKLQGIKIESYDTLLPIYHKRLWKIGAFKNFGDGMQLAYAAPRAIISSLPFENEQVSNGLALFEGFDEESGTHYHFFPFAKRELPLVERLCTKYAPAISIIKNPQSTQIYGITRTFQTPKNIAGILSLLFVLTCSYGSWDIKNNQLLAIKIHLPLSGNAQQREENITDMIKLLQAEGILLTLSIQKESFKTLIQISSNDYELITCFANWYNKEFENTEILSTTTLLEKHQKIREELLTFLKTEGYLNPDTNPKLEDKLSSLPLKFLKH